ncbi:MAG: VOC family protein [Rubrivivax sp.]|nr:VOC family protein [Rubrivivax sp.]
MSARIDHLVVAAATLEQGADWCEKTLGVTPAPGGKHAGVGTHNRLLSIAGDGFAQAYLEIIALDPDAPPPQRPTWFGLGDAAMQARLRERPRLVHAVARCRGLDEQLAALARLGLDAGRARAAERGALRWRIAVRDDGQLLCGGALPTLIEWGDQHPSSHLPPSGVALQALALGGLPREAVALLALPGVECPVAGPALQAVLHTPRGTVTLSSDD